MSLSATDVERFMVAQRDEWNEYAAGWQAWDSQFEFFWQGLTHLLLDALDPQPGMQILDVASGVGQPALTLAPMVGPTGSVTGVDLAGAMVTAARENAEASQGNPTRLNHEQEEEIRALVRCHPFIQMTDFVVPGTIGISGT